ncbi:MAG: hypothetical protein FWC20_10770 [Oscillospiraceae bacterium]|nr:hypothetical protein [Oscillospiraceae bacterium]MCL2279870.1 hypothetical protein [Oscillospiraceae bacterium]
MLPSSCNPIQISVYEDKIYIWNDGTMPDELSSTELLFEKHSSNPPNPKLAGVFFKSGMIEAWGRSFEKIHAECEKVDTPLPKFKISASGVMVLCKPSKKYLELLHGGISITSDPENNSGESELNRNSIGTQSELNRNPIGTQSELSLH